VCRSREEKLKCAFGATGRLNWTQRQHFVPAVSTAAGEAECTAESEGSCKHGGCRALWPRFVALGRRCGIPTRRGPCARIGGERGRRGGLNYETAVENQHVKDVVVEAPAKAAKLLPSYPVAVNPGDNFGILKREHTEDLRGVTWHISARQ
jgi:hypothetical protein